MELAEIITKLYHTEEETQNAIEHFKSVYQKQQAPEDIEEKEVEKVTKISKIFLISISILIAIASFFLRDMVAGLFVDAATQTYLYAKEAMGFFAISFLFSGYNIFSSSYYTALSDGKTSGIISRNAARDVRSAAYVFGTVVFDRIYFDQRSTSY